MWIVRHSPIIASMADLGERRLIHRGRRFDFEVVTHPGPGGKPITREVVRHPGAVVIVPLLDGDRIVLIRNFRIATGDWLLECPAGTLDPKEPPHVCAARELTEETGYRATKIEPLGWFYTTPGLTDERMHAFLATGLTLAGQDLDDDEQIEVVPVPLTKAMAMIDSGDLTDAKSILAILLAQRKGLLGGGR